MKDEKVYLPEHIVWYDYWTNKFYKGGQTITEEFPIEIFPIFVKAGSIVPFSPVQQYVGEKPNSPIELRVYAGSNATFTLYEDEGNNYNYEQGAYNEIELLWNEENRTLTIGESKGNFEGFKKEKVFHITVINPENNGAEKTESNYKECQYDGSSKEISFN